MYIYRYRYIYIYIYIYVYTHTRYGRPTVLGFLLPLLPLLNHLEVGLVLLPCVQVLLAPVRGISH